LSRRLTRHPLLLLEVFWAASVLILGPYAIVGSSPQLPFDLMRRYFGEHVHPVAYKYGLAYFEMPFYAVAKVFHAAGVTTLAGEPIGPAFVALGIGLYVGLGLALMTRLLRRLGLPYPTFTTAIGLVGTPLFFYGVFNPGETHAVDSILAAVIVAVAYHAFRNGWPTGSVAATGALIGVASTIRYFTGVELVALVLTLVIYRRWSAALTATGAYVIAFLALTLPPVLVGASLLHNGYDSQFVSWSPASPGKMLFTDHRGLFIWTPVTLLGLIGIVRLLKTRRAERAFYVFLVLTTAGTIASFGTVAFWDAGYSFSNRYFTPLFPIFVIGIGGLLEWRPRLIGSLATAAAVWSLYLAIALEAFFYFAAATFSATSVAATPLHKSPGLFALAAGSHSPVLHFIRNGRWPVPTPEAARVIPVSRLTSRDS
jgi:hypothetical protein